MKDILLLLKKFRLRHPQIEQLALFGSRAKESADLYSDIDIAIKIDREKLESIWDYFAIIEELKETIHQHFGLHCDIYDLQSHSFTPDRIIYG